MPIYSAILAGVLAASTPNASHPDACGSASTIGVTPPVYRFFTIEGNGVPSDPQNATPAQEETPQSEAPRTDVPTVEVDGPKDDDKPGDKTSDEKKPPTPEHTGLHALFYGLAEDFKHLPSRPNLYFALGGGALAASVHPFDETFNRRLISHFDTVNTAFKPGQWVGQTPIQMGAAVLTFAYGRIAQQPKVSHVGMDLLRAQMLDEALTEALKFSTRRERPNGSNHQSFPSGHSSLTFATATVIERHLGWKKSLLGYAIASYVAASRLHDNRHYLSDVVFGAALGTIAGRTVTQHGSGYWTFMPASVPGGVALVVTRTR